jgi:hypothetical protein
MRLIKKMIRWFFFLSSFAPPESWLVSLVRTQDTSVSTAPNVDPDLIATGDRQILLRRVPAGACTLLLHQRACLLCGVGLATGEVTGAVPCCYARRGTAPTWDACRWIWVPVPASSTEALCHPNPKQGLSVLIRIYMMCQYRSIDV